LPARADCAALQAAGKAKHDEIVAASRLAQNISPSVDVAIKNVNAVAAACEAALKAGDNTGAAKKRTELAVAWSDVQQVVRNRIAIYVSAIARLDEGLALVVETDAGCPASAEKDAFIAKIRGVYETERAGLQRALDAARAELPRFEPAMEQMNHPCAKEIAGGGEDGALIVVNQTGVTLHIHPNGVAALGDFSVAAGETREISKKKFLKKTPDGQEFFTADVLAVGGGSWTAGADQQVYRDATVCVRRDISRDGNETWVVTGGLADPCAVRER
ncbi:MAG TPA: hypothetical protein PLJ34_06545, partial [Hyphomicrobiales bacterium]|nr:hypothetical protein [Hyphomicrobiales bacterium]